MAIADVQAKGLEYLALATELLQLRHRRGAFALSGSDAGWCRQARPMAGRDRL